LSSQKIASPFSSTLQPNNAASLRMRLAMTWEKSMDHRERNLTAINHQQPDRLPTAIWGSVYGIADSLYFELLKELKLGDPILPFRRRLGHTVNY
jgi:hypothetical protein